MIEEDTKKLNNFIKELRTIFLEKRKLVKDIPEDKLVNNEDFNICMKIAAILSTVNTTRASFDAFFALAKDNNYDANVLLIDFDIVWKEEGDKKIPELIPRDYGKLTENK